MEKKALGKGLQALLPEKEGLTAWEKPGIQQIPVTQILPNRNQPRKNFPAEELAELTESVKQKGILQPILVRRTGDGIYELIAGERRYRAAKSANLPNIPAVVRNSTDTESMELALVENIQRANLNPMEEARAFSQLIHEFGLTQELVAERIGKDRSSVANALRLLGLPKAVQDMVEAGQLTFGHAKVILGIPDREKQISVAKRILEGRLSVREVERLLLSQTRNARAQPRIRDNRAFEGLEGALRKKLGTRTTIKAGRRGGEIVISFFSKDDLDRIVEVILG